jgi:1-aminocyclopropane-1-carboxylate synthase 1/2/6
MDVIIFYYRLVHDLCWRTKVQLIPVHCDSSSNFKIIREVLEVAYNKAQEHNINVSVSDHNKPFQPIRHNLRKRDNKEYCKLHQ